MSEKDKNKKEPRKTLKMPGIGRGNHPASRANHIKPGQVLNPKGRPKGKPSLIEKLNKYLTLKADNSSPEMAKLCEGLGLPGDTDVAQVVMAAFIHKTINSQNSGFMTEFMNRMLGKVPEQAQIASEDIVKEVQEAIAQMQGLGAPDEGEGAEPEPDEETHHND